MTDQKYMSITHRERATAIPEDVLAMARYARRISDEAVANAILAERARCAAIATSFRDNSAASGGPWIRIQDGIAAAIRAGASCGN